MGPVGDAVGFPPADIGIALFDLSAVVHWRLEIEFVLARSVIQVDDDGLAGLEDPPAQYVFLPIAAIDV